MKLIVGLGNPGLRYKNTRHNIGFLVAGEIARRFRIPVKKKACNGLLGKGSVLGERIALFMPRTYMNLSGEAVEKILKKERLKPGDMLVIYDDLDLKFGLLRLRKKGSAGGHRGLDSVIERLGTSEFSRLRIGIGDAHKTQDATDFVLSPFSREEKLLLKDILKKAVECVITCLKQGPDRAMAAFNRV